MEYMIFVVGKDSYIQADDVADHWNDLGKDSGDAKVICLGEETDYNGAEGLRPIRYLAITDYPGLMAQIEAEFESEVEIYFGTERAAETYNSLNCK